MRAATGQSALVHGRATRNPLDRRRDRDTGVGAGMFAEKRLVGVVREAAAQVVVKAPDDAEGQKADIAWLRARL